MAAEYAMVGDLPLPKRLLGLIDAGFWPRTQEEARRQNLHPLVSKERIQLFAPEQDGIHLLSPPFHTVDEHRKGRRAGDKFWTSFAAPEGISPELSIVIGDFGIGSDAPILLDYRENSFNPSVIRLIIRWHAKQPNIWSPCAENFDAFADMLGLESSLLPG